MYVAWSYEPARAALRQEQEMLALFRQRLVEVPPPPPSPDAQEGKSNLSAYGLNVEELSPVERPMV